MGYKQYWNSPPWCWINRSEGGCQQMPWALLLLRLPCLHRCSNPTALIRIQLRPSLPFSPVDITTTPTRQSTYRSPIAYLHNICSSYTTLSRQNLFPSNYPPLSHSRRHLHIISSQGIRGDEIRHPRWPSQLVQSQLAKPIVLNAAHISASPLPIPNIKPNPPQPLPFPSYPLGYHNMGAVGAVVVPFTPKPPNGRGSPHLYEMISDTNLHPILFQLEPHPHPFSDVLVPHLLDSETSRQVIGNSNHPLRFFSHLPRWFDMKVDGFMMELWTCLDPRVGMADILDRLNVPDGAAMPNHSTYFMRRMRFRELINGAGWSTGRTHPTQYDVDVVNVLTREQILLNTSMIVDWANQRLLKPVTVYEGASRMIHGYVDSGLPMDCFLQGFAAPIPIPSDRQIVVMELRKRLQTLARMTNLGTAAADYKRLPKDQQHTWWHKKVGEEFGFAQLDGLSHRRWLEKLLVQYPGLDKHGVQRSTPHRPATAAQPPRQSPAVAPAPAPAPIPAPAQSPSSNVDPRLLGPNGGDGLPQVQPNHYRRGGGSVSFYVEDEHKGDREAVVSGGGG